LSSNGKETATCGMGRERSRVFIYRTKPPANQRLRTSLVLTGCEKITKGISMSLISETVRNYNVSPELCESENTLRPLIKFNATVTSQLPAGTAKI
jgi:hypothetical protein